MTFSKYQDKSKPLFQSLKILYIHVDELNMYLIALFMYISYFSNILPKYFDDYLTLNKNIHGHDTRSASNTNKRKWGHGLLIQKDKLLEIFTKI